MRLSVAAGYPRLNADSSTFTLLVVAVCCRGAPLVLGPTRAAGGLGYAKARPRLPMGAFWSQKLAQAERHES